jgi:hypothetical protein
VVSKQETTHLQCQCCGHLYQINRIIDFNMSIINSVCPRCGYQRALNCGNEEEKYLYMNVNLDERYY